MYFIWHNFLSALLFHTSQMTWATCSIYLMQSHYFRFSWIFQVMCTNSILFLQIFRSDAQHLKKGSHFKSDSHFLHYLIQFELPFSILSKFSIQTHLICVLFHFKSLTFCTRSIISFF